ncbi:hypothetical protein GCM10011335_48180 [Aureimonas glaciei]|uniref:Type II toxin-antitoxin system RelE/ParE family toxin n=1 Tax=Aureimonas glaciei TaxID=1776957 RepID=A0A917DIF3_9HYPH|nr:hypothetical protein GCM10011335_48180 [Aureimonas glaciei]
MKLRVSPLAATDIEDIILYIAAENPQAALNVLDAIEQRFAQLLNYPFQGRRGKTSDPASVTSSPASISPSTGSAERRWTCFESCMGSAVSIPRPLSHPDAIRPVNDGN